MSSNYEDLNSTRIVDTYMYLIIEIQEKNKESYLFKEEFTGLQSSSDVVSMLSSSSSVLSEEVDIES